MNILGLSYNVDSHDTSAAIVCEGKLIAAVEEERFTRRKHEPAFPAQLSSFVLSRLGSTCHKLMCLRILTFRFGVDASPLMERWNFFS
jgi:predicted NodU family carbamoyl transferase